MPIIYRCKRCGFILYDSSNPVEYGFSHFHGIPTPSEVIAWWGGRCPRCGRELEKPSLDDIVIGITKSQFLKTNHALSNESGERNEVPTSSSLDRHEARSSPPPGEGQKGETISPDSDEDMESNKKRA